MSIRDRLAHLSRKSGQSADDHGSERHGQDAAAQEALDVARYKYVLRVASPQLLEQVHREAFETLPAGRLGPLYLKMCQDLPEEMRPKSVAPGDLARSAAAAQQTDPGFMLRTLRRPGQGVSEGHSVPGSVNRPGVDLFAGSVLGPFAAAVAASTAASELLAGFGHSLEAAQVDPSLFARGSNHSTAQWIAEGGHEFGGRHGAG